VLGYFIFQTQKGELSMSLPIEKFLTFTENSIIVKAHTMRLYIPEEFFIDGIAEVFSNEIDTFTAIIVSFKNKEDSDEEFFFFDYGVSLRFNFKEETIIVNPFKELDYAKFHVFELYEGNKLINSLTKVQSLKDAQAFIDLLNGGKLPIDVPYSIIPEKIKTNFNLNGMKLPVSSFIIEMLVSEVNRNPKDLHQPFRIIAGRTGADSGYFPLRLKSLPRVSSVFAALSFEDMNASIKASVVMTRNNTKQKQHPLESVIKN
jgi:hypothetical protein